MMVGVDRSVFEAYETQCEELAKQIKPLLPYAGEGSFDGREWCEENNIPETAFAHAVNHHLPEADYGVSPMYPWVYRDE